MRRLAAIVASCVLLTACGEAPEREVIVIIATPTPIPAPTSTPTVTATPTPTPRNIINQVTDDIEAAFQTVGLVIERANTQLSEASTAEELATALYGAGYDYRYASEVLKDIGLKEIAVFLYAVSIRYNSAADAVEKNDEAKALAYIDEATMYIQQATTELLKLKPS